MLQYADWSQHVTHWYPTVTDVAICRPVTRHATRRYPDRRTLQYADWSQRVARTLVPRLSDAAIRRLVTTRPHIGTLPYISTTPLP